MNSYYSLFTRNVFSYKTDWILTQPSVFFTHDWILTEPSLPALSCLLYHKGQQSDECTCMRMCSLNAYKCKPAVYCVFCWRSSLLSCLLICLSAILCCTLLLFVYFFVPYFFILTLLLYFCLLVNVNHVNKQIIFVFELLFCFKNI